MRSIRTYLILALTVLIAAASLTACKATLEQGDEGMYDKQNNVYYRHASTAYEATALLKEYGKMKITDSLSYILYTIPGMDGVEMLATEDLNILYASDVTMPTLMEMAPSILHIGVVGSSSVHAVARIENATQIYSLAYAYTHEESLEYPAISFLHSYKLQFESVEYPGFYYTLTYMEYAEDLVIDGVNYGKYFLRNTFDDRFVPVDDTIHKALNPV